MKVIVNYPNKDDVVNKKLLDKNIAYFTATLISEKIKQLSLPAITKTKVIHKVLKTYEI